MVRRRAGDPTPHTSAKLILCVPQERDCPPESLPLTSRPDILSSRAGIQPLPALSQCQTIPIVDGRSLQLWSPCQSPLNLGSVPLTE